jgi:hypothetical protein
VTGRKDAGQLEIQLILGAQRKEIGAFKLEPRRPFLIANDYDAGVKVSTYFG